MTAAETSVPPWLKRLAVGRHPRRTLARAAALALAAWVVFKFVLLPVRISGGSMAPTYRDGRVNFINRLAYRWRAPRRGDVVGIMTTGPHNLYLKRIIGLPGDTVAIRAGVVWINGRALDEPYVVEREPWQMEARQLGPDEFLFIGDNRGMAKEFHLFGVAKADKIAGKVLW
ncbi:MAG: signal peptidase I [Verrucomicrobia bacterium]|nr:signal peptidase I [Verrucomicrobiota bacterium]